jgi:hypothetical protein
MWDLRKALVASLGEGAGVEKTNRMMFAILQRAAGHPVDLRRGPRRRRRRRQPGERHAERLRHQRRPSRATASPSASSAGSGRALPDERRADDHVPVQRSNDCPGSEIASVDVAWEVRETPSVAGTLTPMTPDAAGYVATLPDAARRARSCASR